MADDFDVDVEAMLEAPYRKEVSWHTVQLLHLRADCAKGQIR